MWISKSRQRLAKIFPPETFLPVLTAILVGGGVGFGAVGYQRLLEAITAFAYGPLQAQMSFLGRFSAVLLPALGALIAGPLLTYFARDAKGHGVPEVMEAVALHGGRISPAIMVNALASVFIIGMGGSAGRVAPVVQIGAGWGFLVARALRLSPERVRNLVACGTAAGIAATFNAPIAGVFFALEVILGELGARSFATLVIAAVTSSVVGRSFLGDFPAFVLPGYVLIDYRELLLYAGLGVLAAFVGVLFVRALTFVTSLFERWQFPEIFEPVVGGLLIGLLGVVFPQILGMGARPVEQALRGQLAWHLMAALIFLKIIATSFTLGSGGAGGIFAPLLFCGAMLGGAYGFWMHRWFPLLTASSGAYALVGMAAVFAAAGRAPITAVLILFEMSRDYRVILPLMLTTVISLVIASLLETESIYTRKLTKQGIDLTLFRELNLMRTISVEEAMTPRADVDPVSPEMPLAMLAERFEGAQAGGKIVAAADGRLYGVATRSDLRRAQRAAAQHAEGWEERRVADICATDLHVVHPDEDLEEALQNFAAFDVGQFPVVLRERPRRWVGVLERDDVIRAYVRAMRSLAERRRRMEMIRVQRRAGAQLVEITLEPGDGAVGRRVAELALPSGNLLVSIAREGEIIVPHGQTQLRAGDEVVILADAEQRDALRELLRAGPTVSAPSSTSPEARLIDFELDEDDAAVGQPVRALSLPENSLLVSVERAGHTLIPHGDTVLLAGDRVTMVVEGLDPAEVRACFLGS